MSAFIADYQPFVVMLGAIIGACLFASLTYGKL